LQHLDQRAGALADHGFPRLAHVGGGMAIDEEALVEMLTTGRLGAACLDGGLKAAGRVFQALFVARERAMWSSIQLIPASR
jgi:hypothetical protein